MENFKRFETVRHGEKQGEKLSEVGVGQAKEKARELLDEIKTSPNGSIFYIMSSNVGRAIETRDIIENELKILAQEEQGIEFISVQDIKRIKQVKGDKSKKYIITDIQPTTALGFNERTPSLLAFLKFKTIYKNNEDLIGKTWAAKPEELEGLKDKIRQEIPDLDVSQINPKEFEETPEEAALKYICLMRRMAEITEKYFPNHPFKCLQIGHNLSADFAAIAILGRDISIESIEKIGGKFRQFLESAYFEVRGGKIVTKYRDQEVEQYKNLDEIIEDLKKASEERKRWWGITS
jgi:broad specificity phosphatase PhoE